MTSSILPTRKRALSSQNDTPETKRRRLSSPLPGRAQGESSAPGAASSLVTADEVARKGLRRGIALILDRIGFDAASEGAMTSFTAMAETYISSLVHDVQVFATASRRSNPIPTDFETSLKRFNVSPAALKPHLRPPIPKAKRWPTWELLPAGDEDHLMLPILGDDLSGTPDKDSKDYIPKSFPSFPSIHTYKYTPGNAEDVTLSNDWGIFDTDPASQALTDRSEQPPLQTRPLAPEEIPRGDPKKLREAAAKEAKAGEEALRRLMRASKIARQKEVWMTAQRQPARRERYDLWEAAMRELIEDEARASGKGLAPAATHGATGRFEIADHSMIVNAEGRYLRKEVPRTGTRKIGAGEIGVGKG